LLAFPIRLFVQSNRLHRARPNTMPDVNGSVRPAVFWIAVRAGFLSLYMLSGVDKELRGSLPPFKTVPGLSLDTNVRLTIVEQTM
jgi:hypothetical protein